MKTSEAIAKLEELKEQHGDLEIGVYDDEYWEYFPVRKIIVEEGDGWAVRYSEELVERFVGIS